MVKIKEFAVERWMDDYENDAKHNLAETCCASISLSDLSSLSGQRTSIVDYDQKQVYGAIRGSKALRSNIANLYTTEASVPVSADNVLVTNGAIQANFLALYTNVGPGDHVICHYPTYQQLYSVPEAFGAQVDLWRSREDAGWQPDLEDLRALVKPNTKLILLNNPQNPTGAVLEREILQGIVDIAREHDIMIHSDEVYRPLFHSLDPSQPEHPPSILSLGYDKVIATGSMSKAFSLAGIRLGWIVSGSSEIIEACASVRHYTIIAVGQLDDSVATLALSTPTVNNLIERNIQLARQNLAALDIFIKEFEWATEWTRPRAGTTAFVKFVNRDGKPIDEVAFCQQLLKQKGVMFVPGSQCFGGGVDFKGYVRIGYVPENQVMIDGLQALREFMRNEYEQLPAATE
ncbi:putative aminotransferase [Aspergillus alliaceus]|uniref:putative aminotransferase n=1 Tax=Petromyces alliaceus TaxID=209559 RepID=UPI0012A6FEBF|nr:pyridoxal phosphate-dependent transferase [Aspergillus alliaceus]KAB8232888.1 pyridoxal phosphate-dependent transferase [Aspergillus alliaceus]